jgi:ketosteroid isomerase-like protein
VAESDTATVATACLDAWSTGDFATARSLLREDVTLEGPLGSADGIEASIGRLAELAQQVIRADRRKVLVDGDDVCIMYDLVTASAGTVPRSDWYHVQAGKIDSVRAYVDPRRIGAGGTGNMSASSGAARPAAAQNGNGLQCLAALISAEMELADMNSGRE